MSALLPVPTPNNPTPVFTLNQQIGQSESGTTILIVEDDRILQELYSERFIAAGLGVIQAYDGMEALTVLEESKDAISLVLLDLMLPKASGYDVLARIKRDPELRRIPVIIVSALSDIDDQARGLQLGADDYITKGEVLPGAVIEKVKAHVARAAQSRAQISDAPRVEYPERQ